METEERRKQAGTLLRVILSPVSGLHKLTGRILSKTIGKEETFTEDAVLSMVGVGSQGGFIEDTSAEIITNAFEFDDLSACDVMTHRVNVVGLEETASLDDIVYLALDEGFSRLPVYSGNIDNITGIIIVKDLLSLIGKTNLDSFSISDFLRTAVFVPESCSCTKLFKTLSEEKTEIAVVIDEYGGTAGIVTTEDLVEEIMGSIRDEYDGEEILINKIGDEKYDIDGESDPEDVLKLFGYTLPDDHEYDTVAGFVTDLLGFIPEADNGGKSTPHVDYEDVRFVAVGVQDNCISRVIAYRKK